MGNNFDIDELFRNSIREFEAKPSKDVWSRIDRSLSKRTGKAPSFNIGRNLALSFLFFTLCLIPYPGNQFASRGAHSLQTLPVTRLSDPGLGLNHNPGPIPEKLHTGFLQQTLQDQLETAGQYTRAQAKADEASLQTGTQTPPVPEPLKRHDFAASQPMSLNAHMLSGSDNADLNERDADISVHSMHLRGMSIGLVANYNQTSLLENENIFRNDRSIQPTLKFGVSKGLSIKYNFNNRFGIETGYLYNSVEGQNYVLSDDNQIVQKSLVLYYDQIPLLFDLKIAHISCLTHHPVSLNYIAGVQYGSLRQYRLPQEKRYETDDAQYKSSEWSFVLGLDYDIYLSSNLYLTAGARGSISNDISTHSDPHDQYAQRNFVFGLHGGLNYVFRNF